MSYIIITIVIHSVSVLNINDLYFRLFRSKTYISNYQSVTTEVNFYDLAFDALKIDDWRINNMFLFLY